MKHTYLLLMVLLLSVLIRTDVSANHILGGELLYKHLSGNTYQIKLIMYGECSGESYPHLKNGVPIINILNNEGAFVLLELKEDINQRADISNVCPAYADKTTCKSSIGTVPGVTRFVYTGNVELKPSASWRILFAGHMDHSGKSQTGLSEYIANVKNNTGYGVHMYLEATLNNTKGPNSSPVFTTDPNPYYCVNTPQEYNLGAIDENKDELKYSLVAPLDINGIQTDYVAPYSATYPFSCRNNYLQYNSNTGQMSFTPSKIEVSLVINKVDEYRDGELVGSCIRAVTFFMINSCNNEAPRGDIDPNSVQGGLLYNNTISLCDTAAHVAFQVPGYDNNSDNIWVTLSNVPAGATATVINNGTQKPLIDFVWDVHTVPPGSYTIYATYDDGACPRPGKQVVAYTVHLARPISIFHEVLSPTNCKYKQFVQFHPDGGIQPRTIEVTDQNNNIIATYTDENNAAIRDSFEVGKYYVLAYSEHLPCSTSYSFEVKDNGTYPDPPYIEDINHCLYESVKELMPLPANGGTIAWYDIDGERLDYTPEYSTDSVKEYKWLINQRVKVCESVYDTVTVSIHDYPDIKTTDKGGHACVGDGIYLTATGGIRYEWEPKNKITEKDNTPYTYIYQPETFIVTGYNEYDCSSTDTLEFTDIEQCCLFSYPNAFTPNNDGVNDGWHPITYGNVDYYLLSVYNRWGERIFTSSDPKEKWNGVHNGKECETGTYYFLLKAECITGHQEEQGGNITLLR